MENYEVNEDTAAVMGVNKNATRVIETENEYFSSKLRKFIT